MYVKKFEGDTLEQALNSIKMELGPDAIILKTVNNKGLKGAFKKKKFEITAAISENSYIKKAKVDRVLSEEQKQKFYGAESTHISHMIDQYNGERKMNSNKGGYGGLGLNKVVSQVNKQGGNLIKEATSKARHKIKTSLDDFLSDDAMEAQTSETEVHAYPEYELDMAYNLDELPHEPEQAPPAINRAPAINSLPKNHEEEMMQSALKEQQAKIDLLEQQLFELTKNINTNKTASSDDYAGLSQLRVTLRALDLDESLIRNILKKAAFELTKDELNDEDVVFEFALREIDGMINCGMPLFASQETAGESVFTVLISEVSTGQTTMALRLATLCPDGQVICYGNRKERNDFAVSMLDLDVQYANSIPEVLALSRKANETGKKVFIDYKGTPENSDETKKFIESMKRSFKNVQTLVTLSAIHSEIFNRRNISKFQEIASGVIISHIDHCLNFGAILNMHVAHQNLPLLFFGTGNVIPDDIETATPERLLAGMFNL